MGRRPKFSVTGLLAQMIKQNAQPQTGRFVVTDTLDDIHYTQVKPSSQRIFRCACCNCTLKPETWHWRHTENRVQTWWCVPCMRRTCGYVPPKLKGSL